MDLAAIEKQHLENILSRSDEEKWLIAEVKRLTGIVTAMEEGCYVCPHPKRVEELTCQKNALQQVIREREEQITRLQSSLTLSREENEKLTKELADANRESAFQGLSWSACAERAQTVREEGRREGMIRAAEIAASTLLPNSMHAELVLRSNIEEAIRSEAKGETHQG